MLGASRFAGVTDALCVWRCVEFFVHDPQILVGARVKTLPSCVQTMSLPMQLVRLLLLQKKTGQCFGLNGAIFLGSILLWDHGLAPGMAWMLAGGVSPEAMLKWSAHQPRLPSNTVRPNAGRLGGMAGDQRHGAAAGSAAGAVRRVLAAPGVLHQLRAELRLVRWSAPGASCCPSGQMLCRSWGDDFPVSCAGSK